MSQKSPIAMLDRASLASWIAGVSVFVLFSTPSIKLYLYTEAINFVPVVLFIVAAALNPPTKLRSAKLSAMILAMLLFMILFAFGAYNSASLNVVEASKYAVLLFLCLAACVAVDRKAIAVAIVLIVVWGLALSVAQLLGGISLDRSRGQHYLTVGYALGSSSLICLLVTSAGRSASLRLLAFLFFLLSLAATGTLLGRGPVLFPIVTVALYVLINTVVDPRVGKVIGRGALFALLVGPLLVYAQTHFDIQRIANRLERLADIANEPRVANTYAPALTAIADQPFGHGLAAHAQVIGTYPHNIFLEVMLSGGVLALWWFLLLVMLFARHIFAASRDDVDLAVKCLFWLTAYQLLIWNVSFELSSAYALLPMMFLLASLDRRAFGHFGSKSQRVWSRLAELTEPARP